MTGLKNLTSSDRPLGDTTTRPRTVEVRKGDSAIRIGKRAGVDWAILLAYNNVKRPDARIAGPHAIPVKPLLIPGDDEIQALSRDSGFQIEVIGLRSQLASGADVRWAARSLRPMPEKVTAASSTLRPALNPSGLRPTEGSAMPIRRDDLLSVTEESAQVPQSLSTEVPPTAPATITAAPVPADVAPETPLAPQREHTPLVKVPEARRAILELADEMGAKVPDDYKQRFEELKRVLTKALTPGEPRLPHSRLTQSQKDAEAMLQSIPNINSYMTVTLRMVFDEVNWQTRHPLHTAAAVTP
jgi:hypothetical protein